MSYTISSYNFTNSSTVSGSLSYNAAISADFQKDSTATSEKGSTQEAYINTTSDFGLEERVRIRRSNPTNVYVKTGIDRAFWAPTTRGVSVNWLINQIWTVSDNAETNPGPEYRVPAKVSLTITLPSDPAVKEADIRSLVQRTVAVLNANGSEHLMQAFRGALSL